MPKVPKVQGAKGAGAKSASWEKVLSANSASYEYGTRQPMVRRLDGRMIVLDGNYGHATRSKCLTRVIVTLKPSATSSARFRPS